VVCAPTQIHMNCLASMFGIDRAPHRNVVVPFGNVRMERLRSPVVFVFSPLETHIRWRPGVGLRRSVPRRGPAEPATLEIVIFCATDPPCPFPEKRKQDMQAFVLAVLVLPFSTVPLGFLSVSCDTQSR